MRIFAIVLGLTVVLLQYRVWLSEHGVREVSRLASQVEIQSAANVQQRERNRQLAAEVTDLKIGLTALEERARSDLGMVGSNETFYQVVTSGAAQSPSDAGLPQNPGESRPQGQGRPVAPAAAHVAVTARAQ